MALTYEELGALMTDFAFRGRVKVAALSYADYILGEPANVTAHNTRMRWANQTYQEPDMAAQRIQSPVCMEPAVKELGANVTDAELQTAVEVVVNRLM
jgi:hypothetical protein